VFDTRIPGNRIAVVSLPSFDSPPGSYLYARSKDVKLNVRVNRKSPDSMTRQIREQINTQIEAGLLAVGTLLPSERELANTLKVARNVVRGAYEQLMDAGRLRSEGRKGRSVKSGGGSKKKKSTTKTTKTKKASKARKK